jgi:hypothetical protein
MDELSCNKNLLSKPINNIFEKYKYELYTTRDPTKRIPMLGVIKLIIL